MRKVTIVGYGRFGETLYRLLRDDFEVRVVVRKRRDSQPGYIVDDLAEAYSSEVIFFAVPISAFEKVLKNHLPYITDAHVLVDVLSVKEYPKRIFERYVKGDTQVLLTHPMFGPDSSQNGFDGLPIVLDKFRTNQQEYVFWLDYFRSKKLKVIEMTAQEHDRLAAKSQGVTHLLGRVLEKYHFRKTEIDSLGTQKLHEVTAQTCNDTWQLFKDLQQYNRYTKRMRLD